MLSSSWVVTLAKWVIPNSNSRTDHAWVCNYFMVSRSLKVKQIMGQYPEYLSKQSDQWMSRGRIIHMTPWEYVWYGVAQWMSVLNENGISTVLPNMDNFQKVSLFLCFMKYNSVMITFYLTLYFTFLNSKV